MVDFTIRTMNRAELDCAIAWAAAEGWNPGLYDADCFYAADPAGFFLGELDGEKIATISAVKYGQFGFIGFYIVKPEYRAQGFGIQLWNAAMAYLQGCNIGLDGVLAQQDNYRKSGFQLAYRNIRYEGIGGGTFPHQPGLTELATISFEVVHAYDKAFFPGDRTAFLNCWIQQPESAGFGIVQNNQLMGYGIVRKCQQGYKIGPLFADRPALAESLFLALKARVDRSDRIYFDTPDVNPAAVSLAEKYQMHPVFETARMYTQGTPDLPYDRLFGVTTFELG